MLQVAGTQVAVKAGATLWADIGHPVQQDAVDELGPFHLWDGYNRVIAAVALVFVQCGRPGAAKQDCTKEREGADPFYFSHMLLPKGVFGFLFRFYCRRWVGKDQATKCGGVLLVRCHDIVDVV